MKQRIMKAGVLLFGLMLLFTIISRTAYNMSTAEVSTEQAEHQTFAPDVSARGTVTGSKEIAVSTVEGLRVGTVRVMEGEAVEAGEILFEVDLQDLTEKMKVKQQELQSLDLQIRGAVESEAAEEQSRQLSRSQAQEDYNRTAARENAAVDAALAELQQAQEEYRNFMADPAGSSGRTEDGQGNAGSSQPELGWPGFSQSDSGQSDSGQSDFAQSGSGQSDSGQSDSGQSDFVQSGSGQSDSGQSDSGQSDFVQSDPAQISSGQTEEQLLAAVQEKQAAYQQALKNREDSLYNAKKSLDSANLETAKNYSVEQSQITRGQKAEEIARLQALLDVQGRVAAPVKGMVTGVSVRAGTATTGGGDILLSDLSDGASLTVTFPEEMRKYIREGSQAVVTAENSVGGGSRSGAETEGSEILPGVSETAGQAGQQGASETAGQAGQQGTSETGGQAGQQGASDRVTIRTLADTSMTGTGGAEMEMIGAETAGSMQGASSGGGFTVTVDLPPEHFTAGETAVLRVEVQPDSYDTCIPTGALHLREKGQYYVNAAEKQSTILGEEWVVRRVDVKVLEKNEKYAAVEGISAGQEIVTEASRILEDGSRVKMKDEKQHEK